MERERGSKRGRGRERGGGIEREGDREQERDGGNGNGSVIVSAYMCVCTCMLRTCVYVCMRVGICACTQQKYKLILLEYVRTGNGTNFAKYNHC